MKVLLISANAFSTPYPVYPLGLDYVAGAISPQHQVKMFDVNGCDNHESLGKTTQAFAPDIIGLSLRNIDTLDSRGAGSFIHEYKELISALRQNSKACLVLGGSGFTIFPAELMKALEADYGIIGEGERLDLLLQAMEKGEDIQAIPGVINKDSTFIWPDPWNQRCNRRFDPEDSHLQFYLKRGGMLNLQTKRGCPFHCLYCIYPHIEGKHLRYMRVADVAQEARLLQESGAKFFFITDASFNSCYDHSLEVALAFRKARISIPWGAFFTPTSPPQDYYKRLAEAGLTHVEFGTDSLSNKMLEHYRKPFLVNQVLSSHEQASEAGLHVAHYILMGGPGEDKETINVTIGNASKLEKTVFFVFCGIRILPQTDLCQIAIEEGQVSKAQSLMNPVFYRSKFIGNEEMIERIESYATGRLNWVFGNGGQKMAEVISRMHVHGHSGPLWEHLVQ